MKRRVAVTKPITVFLTATERSKLEELAQNCVDRFALAPTVLKRTRTLEHRIAKKWLKALKET